MSSHFNFLLSGVPEEYQRKTYPEDKIEAKEESSFRFNGETEIYPDGPNSQVVVIDKAARLTTVSSKLKDKALFNLKERYQYAGCGAAFSLGLIGGALATRVIVNSTNSSTKAIDWIPLALLGAYGAVCLYRAVEASNEYEKWKEDPISKYCLYRLLPCFDQIVKENLQGKVFTLEETKLIHKITII